MEPLLFLAKSSLFLMAGLVLPTKGWSTRNLTTLFDMLPILETIGRRGGVSYIIWPNRSWEGLDLFTVNKATRSGRNICSFKAWLLRGKNIFFQHVQMNPESSKNIHSWIPPVVIHVMIAGTIKAWNLLLYNCIFFFQNSTKKRDSAKANLDTTDSTPTSPSSKMPRLGGGDSQPS